MKKQNIIIFMSDFLVSHLTLNKVLPALIEMGLQPRIFITPQPANTRSSIRSLRHYRFYDYTILPDVVYPILRAGTAKNRHINLPLDILADKYNVKIEYIAAGSNDSELMARLEKINFIGLLSLNNISILKPETVDFFKNKGFVWNLHRGILPEYRGLHIPFWSLMQNQINHGITLHELTNGIDVGDVIESRIIPLDKRKPVIRANIDLYEHGADMVVNAVGQYIDQGQVKTIPQDLMKSNYYTFPTEDDIATARAQGIRLWGTPLEMLKLYTDLFGTEEVLVTAITNAIAAHEDISDFSLRDGVSKAA